MGDSISDAWKSVERYGFPKSKQRIQDAHDAAVAQMDGLSLELHRTDCAVCQDFGRPLPDRTSSGQK